jgi:hypothetical protein
MAALLRCRRNLASDLVGLVVTFRIALSTLERRFSLKQAIAIAFGAFGVVLGLASLAMAQASNNPVTLSVTGGVDTSQINAGSPTIIPVCSGGSCIYTWNYFVAAVDAAGGISNTASGSTSAAASYLTTSAYNLVVTAPVVGSITCNIRRPRSSPKGRVGLPNSIG